MVFMELNPSLENYGREVAARSLHDFEEAHKEDLATITEVLAKITHRSPEQIKPHLEAMLEHLVEPQEHAFYVTATPEERARAFREWAESHESNTPLLSDYAVSRESMYDDGRL
jgi:GH25 family lysozyme M1 (1,4-beta-N-acetylmuramidase)